MPFIPRKERIKRVKWCIYVLGILAALCSLGDKIMTYLAIGTYGHVELNPLAAWLMSSIGLLPACIVGYFATLLPVILIFYGMKRFNLYERESYLWLFIFILTVYFVIFLKLFEAELMVGF